MSSSEQSTYLEWIQPRRMSYSVGRRFQKAKARIRLLRSHDRRAFFKVLIRRSRWSWRRERDTGRDSSSIYSEGCPLMMGRGQSTSVGSFRPPGLDLLYIAVALASYLHETDPKPAPLKYLIGLYPAPTSTGAGFHSRALSFIWTHHC